MARQVGGSYELLAKYCNCEVVKASFAILVSNIVHKCVATSVSLVQRVHVLKLLVWVDKSLNFIVSHVLVTPPVIKIYLAPVLIFYGLVKQVFSEGEVLLLYCNEHAVVSVGVQLSEACPRKIEEKLHNMQMALHAGEVKRAALCWRPEQ